MSLYRISYRLIGLFMIVVALWRMNGGGDGFVERLKVKVSSLTSRKDASVIRPYYPEDVGREQVDAVDAVRAPTATQLKGAKILNGRETTSDYYSDWYPAQR